jgi:hypothetical protein
VLIFGECFRTKKGLGGTGIDGGFLISESRGYVCTYRSNRKEKCICAEAGVAHMVRKI